MVKGCMCYGQRLYVLSLKAVCAMFKGCMFYVIGCMFYENKGFKI